MRTRNLIAVAGLVIAGSMLASCYQRHDDYVNPNYNNNYNGNNYNNYQTSFDDEFNGSDNYGWTFSDPADSAYASLSGGYYQYVDYSTSLSNMSAVTTGINVASNFSVKTSLKSNKQIGLIFGASSTDNGYAFYIDTSGNYSLYKEGIGSVASTVIIPSTADTPYAIKNGWNMLEVDQTNGTWTGYVNGTQVFSMAARAISGSNFGFKVLPGTVGYADYLRVAND